MADLSNVFTITANTWVKVVNGSKTATIYRSKKDATYYAMLQSLVGDTPTGTPGSNTTAKKIFLNGIVEELNSSVDAYVWLRCAPDQVGNVIVT